MRDEISEDSREFCACLPCAPLGATAKSRGLSGMTGRCLGRGGEDSRESRPSRFLEFGKLGSCSLRACRGGAPLDGRNHATSMLNHRTKEANEFDNGRTSKLPSQLVHVPRGLQEECCARGCRASELAKGGVPTELSSKLVLVC